MAVAAAQGALANVEINLDGISDSAYVAQMRAKIAALRELLGNASHITTA
jgi:formiminotetrahydrofolate cyclodeaminase